MEKCQDYSQCITRGDWMRCIEIVLQVSCVCLAVWNILQGVPAGALFHQA